MGQLHPVRSAYRECRRINARHGRTYFLATRMLPADRRPAVHALYGFARVADEIVDAPGADLATRARALDALAAELRVALDGGPARPVLVALADTVRRYGIRVELLTEFLASMRMDLTVTDYASFAELARYMHGSAGVIGLQLLPVLGTVGPIAAAEPAASALGEAFQLTNFLRDVGEDLDRGRVYLPAEELAAFGVDRSRLVRARRTGRPDPAIRRALAHLVAYTPTPCTAPPSPGSPCCAPSPGRACAPPARSTAASWTRSSPPTTPCSTAGSPCPRAAGHWSPPPV